MKIPWTGSFVLILDKIHVDVYNKTIHVKMSFQKVVTFVKYRRQSGAKNVCPQEE